MQLTDRRRRFDIIIRTMYKTHHEAAQRFFEEEAGGNQRFLLCGPVLVEIYMQLRNPAVFKKPKTAREAASFCDSLRAHP
jgi:predicted nucleic acid-binding protein